MGTYRMAQLRKQKNITQLELANALGVSKGAVGMWEVGKRTPSLSMAKLIGQYFGVAVEEIEFGKNSNRDD